MIPLLVVTATGGRSQCFTLCEKWMSAQTYNGPMLWLVVDDGDDPTVTTMGQTVIRRKRGRGEPTHTLALNIREALPYIRDAERVLLIEDDDLYGPLYIEKMMGWLDSAPLVGEVGAKYYHVGQRAYRHFTNHTHASLCRTGFRTAEVLPTFEKALDYCLKRRTPMIDLKLWGYWPGPSHKFRDKVGDARLCVGIKGMPGRTSNNHNRADYIADPDLTMLKLWVGDDHTAYLPFLGEPLRVVLPEPVPHIRLPRRIPQPPEDIKPLIVYTAIIGDYDRLSQAPASPYVRYVCFMDQRHKTPWLGWEIIAVGDTPDPVGKVRELKMSPHELFPNAEHSLWIDGSMRLRVNPRKIESASGNGDLYLCQHNQRDCIIEEAAECMRLGRSDGRCMDQARHYIDAGHPEHWGLYCGGFLYRRHTSMARTFNETWLSEFRKWHTLGSSRDQVSLAPVLRMVGIGFAAMSRGELGRFVSLRPHAVITEARRAAEARR